MGVYPRRKGISLNMLVKRSLVVAVLLPVGLVVILLGGFWYFATIALVLVLAAPEFAGLFRAGGFQPAGFLISAGTLLLVTVRRYWGIDGLDWAISLVILGTMTYHLVQFERGRHSGRHQFLHHPGWHTLPGMDRRLPDLSTGYARRNVVGIDGAPICVAGRYRGLFAGKNLRQT